MKSNEYTCQPVHKNIAYLFNGSYTCVVNMKGNQQMFVNLAI